jgi:hypothetical protein
MRVIDARSPWPTLTTIFLNSVPRPGDSITIDLGDRRAGYKIDFVRFDPNDDIQVALGCLPSQSGAAGQIEQAKINEFLQTQEKAFQQAEAYSKTMVTLGYAGLFGIWAFVKDHLSHRAILVTALLAGFSLIIYVAWEVGQMIHRTTLQLRLNRALKEHPTDQAKAINDFVERTRAGMVRGGHIWMVIQILTVIPGFLAALVLIYNVFADLTGLLPRP